MTNLTSNSSSHFCVIFFFYAISVCISVKTTFITILLSQGNEIIATYLEIDLLYGSLFQVFFKTTKYASIDVMLPEPITPVYACALT